VHDGCMVSEESSRMTLRPLRNPTQAVTAFEEN